MNILITFTGFHDPYSEGLVAGEEQVGPILSLTGEMGFDRVILLSTPKTKDRTRETGEAIISRHKDTDVEIREVAVNDPIDYFAIMKSLRGHIQYITGEYPGAEYFVSVTSGTPQMHACWLLLVAGGELPARLLNVRPLRYVDENQPLVSELDLTASEFPEVRAGISTLEPRYSETYSFAAAVGEAGIVGDHKSIQDALGKAEAVAHTDYPVLILGETGTGKELFSKLIHILSGRKGGFVEQNCAGMPEQLVESILFGHKRGAFTGAVSDQEGKFSIANNGTLFLDELGELPLMTQAKLLRVLQDGIVEPLGARTPQKVDVRVVAATNRDIGKAIKEGEFREDLYYRLNTMIIRLSPLRERRSDIPKIAMHLLDNVNRTIRESKRFTQDALKKLQGYNWPGNVRELKSVIANSAMMARGKKIDADDINFLEPLSFSGDAFDAVPEPHEGFVFKEYEAGVRRQLYGRPMIWQQAGQRRCFYPLFASHSQASDHSDVPDDIQNCG